MGMEEWVVVEAEEEERLGVAEVELAVQSPEGPKVHGLLNQHTPQLG